MRYKQPTPNTLGKWAGNTTPKHWERKRLTPLKLCNTPGCPNPAITNRGKCTEHHKVMQRDRSTRRRETTKGVYKTKQWLMRRKAVLEAAEYICQDGRACNGNALATEVDHLTPLTHGGAEYDTTNLRATCRACHDAKTAQENTA